MDRYSSNGRASSGSDEKEIFAGYGGSASCRECHATEYALWKKSNHGLAERAVSPAMDHSAFNPPRTFTHDSQQTSVSQVNGRYQVVTLGPSNKPEGVFVERVIGNDPLRQFLVKFPGGRYQVLDAAYDPHRGDWFDVYGNEDRRPGDWGYWTGRGMNWNSMCAACHNTRLLKNYDVAADSYRTVMAEPSVSCESCHGPMRAHNDWQKRFGKSGKKDPTLTKLSPRQIMENCAYCHSRRSELTGDFKPGDKFFDHARLALVDATETFYADGQVRNEDYEFSAFLGSKMRMKKVTCMDCHNPHSAKTNLSGNALCMRCHNGGNADAPVINPVTHSHHKVFGYDDKGNLLESGGSYNPKHIKETGGECVNCHMPQTIYMQRHSRHDHGFTTPDPLLTKQLAIPNACNRCHQDKDADWALQHCEQWYGQKMVRPSRDRAQVVAAAQKEDPTAAGGLLRLLATEQNSYWRAVFADLLQPWVNEPQVKEALKHCLSDADPQVRAESIRSLEPLIAGEDSDIREAVAKHLEDPVRNVRVAAAWALRGTLDPASKAGTELLRMLDIVADQPIGQMQSGAYAAARGDNQQAVKHYAKAVEWDPNSAPIRNDYAVVLAAVNRSRDAVAQMEEACKLEPKNAEYHYRLGLALNEIGDMSRTIDELRTTVELDPKFSRAWYNLGLALNASGESEQGLKALAQAEMLTPADPHIPYARATILARLGDVDRAKEAAQRALQIDERFQPARDLLRSLDQ
jgi:predicted CXXCH cytochrome family protein